MENQKKTDVHTRHCCMKCGCKYGQDDICTVVQGEGEQEYKCEDCEENKKYLHEPIKQYLKENLRIEIMEGREYDFEGKKITITLYLDNEKICSDYICL